MTDKLVDPAWLDALLSLFCQQRALTAGQLNATTFRVLAELGRMRNERILKAMEAHLVQGWTREEACAMYGVNNSYFSRRLADVNRVWQLTEILRVNRENSSQDGPLQGEKNDTSEMERPDAGSVLLTGRMRHRGRDEKNGGTESGTRQAGTGHRHAASLGGHSSGCGPDRAVIRHGKLQPGAGGSEAAGQPAL